MFGSSECASTSLVYLYNGGADALMLQGRPTRRIDLLVRPSPTSRLRAHLPFTEPGSRALHLQANHAEPRAFSGVAAHGFARSRTGRRHALLARTSSAAAASQLLLNES